MLGLFSGYLSHSRFGPRVRDEQTHIYTSKVYPNPPIEVAPDMRYGSSSYVCLSDPIYAEMVKLIHVKNIYAIKFSIELLVAKTRNIFQHITTG